MKGIVIQGHQVASGQSPTCPWIGGSVALQLPIMEKFGVPVDGLYAGTLNVALTDYSEIPYPAVVDFDIIVDWRAPEKPTHFLLHRMSIRHRNMIVTGLAYRKSYPHGYVSIHPQPLNVIEVLAPWLQGVVYGSELHLDFNAN